MTQASNMTKKEAALVRLRLMAHQAFGAMVENRGGGGEEAQKDLDAIDWAIATIQSKIARPQPDPDTGLVPCGCGGRADCNDTGITSKDGKQLWWVECTACGISTYGHQQKGKAKAAWNRSMSGEVVSKTEKTTQEDQE